MKPLLIIKVGDTLPALRKTHRDFEHWIHDRIKTDLPVQIVDPRRGETLPLQDIAGVIVTGSESMVTDREAWSERAASWLPRIVGQNTPVLGICYGHQLLAHALKGEVADHPGGLEFGTVSVKLTDLAQQDSLFRMMPQTFKAQAAHRQSVLRLPPNSVLLAGNDSDPHQAFRFGECAWGVQFHPEFSSEVMALYIEHEQSELLQEGFDPAQMRANVAASDAAAGLLQTFGDFIAGRHK